MERSSDKTGAFAYVFNFTSELLFVIRSSLTSWRWSEESKRDRAESGGELFRRLRDTARSVPNVREMWRWDELIYIQLASAGFKKTPPCWSHPWYGGCVLIAGLCDGPLFCQASVSDAWLHVEALYICSCCRSGPGFVVIVADCTAGSYWAVRVCACVCVRARVCTFLANGATSPMAVCGVTWSAQTIARLRDCSANSVSNRLAVLTFLQGTKHSQIVVVYPHYYCLHYYYTTADFKLFHCEMTRGCFQEMFLRNFFVCLLKLHVILKRFGRSCRYFH